MFPPSLKVIVHRFNCSQRHGLLRPAWIFQCHGFSSGSILVRYGSYCSLALILKWFRNKSLRDLSEQAANIQDGYFTSLTLKRYLFELEPQLIHPMYFLDWAVLSLPNRLWHFIPKNLPQVFFSYGHYIFFLDGTKKARRLERRENKIKKTQPTNQQQQQKKLQRIW